MVKAHAGNRLLDLLPASEREDIQSLLRNVQLASGQVLYEAHGDVEAVYFPTNCVLSAVTTMRDGAAIEVASMGNEGVSGSPASSLVLTSPHRILVQIGGNAWQADAADFNKALKRLSQLREVINKYQQALMFQVCFSAACNGLHVIAKRGCRWLLMMQDRVDGDELPLTHEFVSYMLGVRRSSVTEFLQSLQVQGVISYAKGQITVLDRKRLEKLACECYQSVRDEYERLLG